MQVMLFAMRRKRNHNFLLFQMKNSKTFYDQKALKIIKKEARP